MSKTSKMKLKCLDKNCYLEFDSALERLIHANENHEDQISCPYENCGILLKVASLYNHISFKHEKRKATCEFCGLPYIKSRARQHQRSCISYQTEVARRKELNLDENPKAKKFGDQVHCPYKDCGVVLKKTSLHNHICFKHERQNTVCEYCGKQVIRSRIAQHHKSCQGEEVTRRGEKRFSCPIEGCGAVFETNHHRCCHLRVHKTPIRCPEPNCDSWIKPHKLGQHLRLVHRKETKPCPNCDRQLPSKSLTHHLRECRKNERMKRFACQEENCDTTFVTEQNLKKHMLSVHGTEIIKIGSIENSQYRVEIFHDNEEIELEATSDDCVVIYIPEGDGIY